MVNLKVVLYLLLIFLRQNSATNANVERVEVTGSENKYRFAVTISSPDRDCSQYANWWEVISPEGELLYRRILAHSHVKEQPFTRSGGIIELKPDQTLIIRAHMNNTGYGGQVLKGSINKGFQPHTFDEPFAEDLSTSDPQPDGCAF